jgi:hypothetical protein
MDGNFGNSEFQAYFSRFYGEFSKLYAEFQEKSAIYGDFWQFVLAKAARELGILETGEDRRLTEGEIQDLYGRVLASMPHTPGLLPGAEVSEEAKEDQTEEENPPSVERDSRPGKTAKPEWFTLVLPDEKKSA